MSLDLGKTAQQINTMAAQLEESQDNAAANLARALDAMGQADVAALQRKQEASGELFDFPRPAGVTENLITRYSPSEAPTDFCVLAVDGSHIDVDRHIPVRCYIINIGGCLLTYGSHPDAHLFSQPHLYTQHEELYLTDPTCMTREVPVEGAVLGLKRTVEETKALADRVGELPPGLPALALLDGSLTMWGFPAQGQDFVRDVMLKDGLVPALDALHAESQRRALAVASYISLPGSTEVVNALRMYQGYCPYDVAACRDHCGSLTAQQRPCHEMNDLLDRQLFEALLAPGERSGLFYSTSSVVQEHYGPHQVYFFYLNVGVEIARVEMPQWVALDEKLLGVTHALVLDQCQRGMGYPAAITEAHEQAVISGSDRERFRELVEASLTGHRLPVYTSEKSRAKRLRWV